MPGWCAKCPTAPRRAGRGESAQRAAPGPSRHDRQLPDPREDTRSDLRALCASRRARELDGDDLACEVVTAEAEGVVARVESRLVEHAMHDSVVPPLCLILERVPEQHPETPEQARDCLRLLEAVPDFLGRSGQRHRDGVRAGRLPVARRVRAATDHVDAHLAAPQGDPLRKPPLSSEDERNRLLEKRIRPAFATYREGVRGLPGRSDDEPGLGFLPDGERTYASWVRMHTTIERTPQGCTGPGWSCWRNSTRSTPRSAPASSACATSPTSTTGCAPIRRCTGPAARNSWTPRKAP
ncbi:DUF885 family protein [Saccharopolyspora rhizosphaerae]|uniref:DUF885 family protein n=1 Tax=Saccharopolyspora rhizosphaerae TaxID=2492662 RepID=UPI002D7840C1|nr:DUF885 family protein [Saccharopolyspora rhizosphaerae]